MLKNEGQHVKKQWKTPVVEELSVPTKTEAGTTLADDEDAFYTPS